MLRLIPAILVAGLAVTPTFAADPPAKAGPATPAMNSTQAINHYIGRRVRESGHQEAREKATDLEFHRRVFLDLVGRIPTAAEVLAFEGDKATDKRAKLVRRLLYGRERMKRAKKSHSSPSASR